MWNAIEACEILIDQYEKLSKEKVFENIPCSVVSLKCDNKKL